MFMYFFSPCILNLFNTQYLNFPCKSSAIPSENKLVAKQTIRQAEHLCPGMDQGLCRLMSAYISSVSYVGTCLSLMQFTGKGADASLQNLVLASSLYLSLV